MLAAWLAATPLLATAAIEQVVTIPTRAGVTDTYLLVTTDAAPKKVVALSFTGARGQVDLARRAEGGTPKFGPGANFLVRIRGQLASADIADVIVDAPSDQLAAGGMPDAFRAGSEHATDVRAVIDDVRKRYPDARVFLVGTSRGTISAANLGVALKDRIAGVILSSTVTQRDRGGPGLSTFDWTTLAVPVLVVHHVDDACPSSPYRGVTSLSPRFSLVSVHGGDAPLSAACDAQAPHGYLGVEAPVVAVMQQFMLGQPYAQTIP